jgi:hypothetical protein
MNRRPRNLSHIAIRDEAKQVRPVARPLTRKKRRRIRWHTLKMFSGRERRRCLRIIHRSRTVNVELAPTIHRLFMYL